MLNESMFEADILSRYWTIDDHFFYNKSDPIYHYTSPDGFMSILQPQNVVLRFSRYDTLNDESEGKDIFKIYSEVCNDLRHRKLINECFYNEICNLKFREIDFFRHHNEDDKLWEMRSKQCERYICCFSKDKDSLPMWNYYTKEGRYQGYNIAFSFFESPLHISYIHKTYVDQYNIRIYQVLYRNSDKKKFVEDEILYIYSKITDFDNQISLVKSYFSSFLKTMSLVFKSECFEHENEVRMILTLPKDQEIFPVKYRSKDGYIIPYVEYCFPTNTVKSITLGPLLNKETAKEAASSFLEQRGYSVKTVENSEIPVRY